MSDNLTPWAICQTDMSKEVGNVLDHWEQLPNDLRFDPGFDALNKALEKLYRTAVAEGGADVKRLHRCQTVTTNAAQPASPDARELARQLHAAEQDAAAPCIDQKLSLAGKATDHIWLMEDIEGYIGIRMDCGDAGTVYVTHKQARDLAEQLQSFAAGGQAALSRLGFRGAISSEETIISEPANRSSKATGSGSTPESLDQFGDALRLLIDEARQKGEQAGLERAIKRLILARDGASVARIPGFNAAIEELRALLPGPKVKA